MRWAGVGRQNGLGREGCNVWEPSVLVLVPALLPLCLPGLPLPALGSSIPGPKMLMALTPLASDFFFSITNLWLGMCRLKFHHYS